MDEAVIRVVLEDAGQGGAAQPPSISAPRSTQPAQPAAYSAAPITSPLPAQRNNFANFDPVDEARKRVERENRLALVDVEYAKLKPPVPAPPFDPMEAAQKRIEREDQLAAADLEYAKLKPPVLVLVPAFDPVEVARKRVEREEQQAAADAEYAKIKPVVPILKPAFDPQDEARKRREAEQKKAQTDAAYNRMYGDPKSKDKSQLDSVMDIAGGLRGTIGGQIGTMGGAALDAMAGFRKAQAAGGAGGAASAVPMIAAAIALDQAVKGAIKGTIGGVGGALKAAADPDNNPAKAIEGMSAAVSSFGEKIPVIGYALTALGETGKMLGGLMQAFTKQAERYGEYNPQIAQAQAMAEIRQVMGDMRRAQRSGTELARFIEEQSRMQQQFEEIKMRIWMKILPVITAILEILGRFLNVIEAQDETQFETPTDVILRAGVQVPSL